MKVKCVSSDCDPVNISQGLAEMRAHGGFDFSKITLTQISLKTTAAEPAAPASSMSSKHDHPAIFSHVLMVLTG